MVYSTDRSKAVVPVVPVVYYLLLCGLFYKAICFRSCLVYFVLAFFSPFSIASTSLGKDRANLSFVQAFDLRLFGFVCFLFLLVFMRTEFLCVSVLRVASEPRVKLASCKSVLISPPPPPPPRPLVYSIDRSKAVVSV